MLHAEVLDALERMSEGMAEVEGLSYALPLLRIALYVRRLHLQRKGQHRGKGLPIAREHILPVVHQEVVQIMVCREERMLDHLSQTAHVLALRQRPQAGR